MSLRCAAALLELSLGANILNLWPVEGGGLRPARVDSWYGWGGDASVLAPVGRCVQVGLREQLVVQIIDEDPQVYGRRTTTVTQLQAGSAAALSERVQLGIYALPGVRTTWIHDRVQYAHVQTDYRERSVIPSWSAMAVVRWFPREHLGLHASLRVPVADLWRATNFADQFLGIGLDVRLPRPQEGQD